MAHDQTPGDQRHSDVIEPAYLDQPSLQRGCDEAAPITDNPKVTHAAGGRVIFVGQAALRRARDPSAPAQPPFRAECRPCLTTPQAKEEAAPGKQGERESVRRGQQAEKAAGGLQGPGAQEADTHTGIVKQAVSERRKTPLSLARKTRSDDKTGTSGVIRVQGGLEGTKRTSSNRIGGRDAC